MMIFIGVDVVGDGSEDFIGGRVWERLVWGIGEERVLDWRGILVVALEVMGVEGWGEGR